MPHTNSAKKRLRQNKKRNEHNREIKKDIKIQIKELFRALKADDQDAIQKELKLCTKKLDKAAGKRIIHPNKVARRKSQLAKAVKAKLSTASEEA